MGLTIRMKIDEHDEHTYVYSTGDGENIELIPLSVVANGRYEPAEGTAYNLVTVNVPTYEVGELNITHNGTYTAEDGHVWNVVTVDVDPLLEIVSRSYTENGTYTIQPTEGYDGISDVTVVVDVPQDEPNLETLNEFITQNDTYSFTPSQGYDGFDEVNVDVDVEPTLEHLVETITQNGTYSYNPSQGYDGFDFADIVVNVSGGGGSSNVVFGTFTPTDGQSQTISTGHTGVVRAIFITPVDKTVLDNSSITNITRAYSAYNIGTGNSSYFWKLETHRSSSSGSTLAANSYYQVQTNSAQGGAPSNCVGISSDGGTIYYRGKSASVSGTYGFLTTATYQYMIVYDS